MVSKILINFLIFIFVTYLNNFSKCLEKAQTQTPLIVLNEKNVKNYLNSAEHFLILFHNPWCKFSQRLEKKLLKVNTLLKMESQKFYIGSIDVTIVNAKEISNLIISKNIMDSVFTYPKLVYFYKGEAIETYTDLQAKNEIYTYIKRKIYPFSAKLSNYETFEDKITHDKSSFVFFGDYENELNSDERQKYEKYNKLAGVNLGANFYHTKDIKTNQMLNANNNSTVIFYRFGKPIDRMLKTAIFTEINLLRFIRANTYVNFFDKLTDEAINEIFIKKQNSLILIRNTHINTTEFLELNFPLIAKNLKDLKVVVMDLTGKYELKLAKLIGVNDKELPTVRLLDFSSGVLKKFEMSRDLSVENVINFVSLWKQGKLHPYITSESNNNRDSGKKEVLKKITNALFFESVIFNKRNVIVFFHTSWCSHCKKIIPTLELLAKKYNPEVFSFLSMDLEENDPSNHNIQKVPTIHLYNIK